MNSVLLDILGTFLSFLPTTILCFFSFDISKYKYSVKKTLIILFGYILAVSVLISVCVSFIPNKTSYILSLISNLSFIGFSLVGFVIFDGVLKEDSVKKLIVYLLAMNYEVIVYYAYNILFDLVGADTSYVSGMFSLSPLLMQLCVTAVTLPFAYLAFRKMKKYIDVIDSKTNRKLLVCVIIVIIVYMFAFVTVDMQAEAEINYTALFFSFTFCVIMLYVMLFLICYYNKKESILMLEKQQTMALVSMQAELYDNTLQNIAEMKKIRHDLKHHLAALQGIITTKSTGEHEKISQIKEYLFQFGKTVDIKQDEKFCGDAALNSLLNHYFNMAAEQGIKVECGISLPDEVFTASTHLCIIVGNLLLNAIEGAMTEEENNRYIKIKMLMYNDDVLVTVDNSYDGNIVEKNGKFYTTKKNGSGLGIESVKGIASIYNGYCSFEHDEHEFRASVRLQKKEM